MENPQGKVCFFLSPLPAHGGSLPRTWREINELILLLFEGG
jgi:hypothetical protein